MTYETKGLAELSSYCAGGLAEAARGHEAVPTHARTHVDPLSSNNIINLVNLK